MRRALLLASLSAIGLLVGTSLPAALGNTAADVGDAGALLDGNDVAFYVESPTYTPAAPAKPGKSPKPGKKPKKPKEPKGPKSTTTISNLRAVPKRIKRGRGLPKLLSGRSRPGFQFELSKVADITLTLERCKSKRGCAKREAIRGSRRFKKAPAGESTIRFKGRLTGPKLPKGRYRATLGAKGGKAQSVLFRLF